jgi:hypothetical protein
MVMILRVVKMQESGRTAGRLSALQTLRCAVVLFDFSDFKVTLKTQVCPSGKSSTL